MHTQLHPLVTGYLDRLDRAAASLPVDRRAELTEGIREHLDAALAGSAADDEGQVRDVLTRLGGPEEIVATAYRESGQPWSAPWPSQPTPWAAPSAGPPSAGGHEIAAVILLLIGGLVVPVVGWLVGVILLWTSKRWTNGDKLLGTFVVPGGLLGAFIPGVVAMRGALGGLTVPVMSFWVVPLLIQILVAVHLIRRARRPA